MKLSQEVVVEIRTDRPEHVPDVSAEDRSRIQSAIGDSLEVLWRYSPPEGSQRFDTTVHFTAESALLLSLVIAHSPFGDSLQKEIAKDVWKGARAL